MNGIRNMSVPDTLVVFICALAFLLMAPMTVTHAAVNAGVVNGVWFSNSNPQEGDAVRIFTAVQNQSDETVAGTVTFLVNEAVVGSKAFSVVSNDVVPVSIAYTFSGGTFNVSAYISSVAEQQSVTHTLAPKISVSVAHKANETSADTQATTQSTSSTMQATAETIVHASKLVLATADPVAEAAASKVEAFRDTLLAGTSTASAPQTKSMTSSTRSTKAAAQDFVATSKTIAKGTELPLWKKVVGVLLTLAAFLMRIWFLFIVLIVAFIAWRLVRGVRIR